MSEITMSRAALGLHLSAVEEYLSRIATLLVTIDPYVNGERAFMVRDAMGMADEQVAGALSAINDLKVNAGIKTEAQVTT
jgi:hypothetical protein